MHNDIKLIYKKLAAFLLLIAPMFMIGHYFLSPIVDTDFPYRSKFNEVFNAQENAEVVIFGACSGLATINPKILEALNPKVYNFSLHGAGPFYIVQWYTKIFKNYYKKPKLIIISIEMIEVNQPRNIGYDSEYFPISLFLKLLLFDREIPFKYLLYNKYPFIKNRFLILRALLSKTIIDESFQWDRYYKGYAPLIAKEKLGEMQTIVSNKNKSMEIKNSPEAVADLKRMIQLFKDENIPVVYLTLPYYYTHKSSYLPHPAIQEIRDVLKQEVDGKNVFYLDYNNDHPSNLNYDESFWYNQTHLNENGSNIFTQKLKNDLFHLIPPAHKNIFVE